MSEVIDKLTSRTLLGKPNIEVTNNPEYQRLVPELRKLYEQAWRWHGTGRYQYSKDEKGAVVVRDVLIGIIEDNGLIPHKDPLDYSQGEMYSISTSPSRIYSSLYALPHYEMGKRLRNPFQTKAAWFYYGMTAVFTAIQHDRRLLSKKFRVEHNLSKKGVKYFYDKYTKADPRDFDFTGGGISDIKGNYPMLIGIKEGAFEESNIAKVLQKHESRSKTPIKLDNFTHIEVPEDYITEVKRQLDLTGNNSIPVIPLEWGEEFSKSLPTSFLRDGIPLKT